MPKVENLELSPEYTRFVTTLNRASSSKTFSIFNYFFVLELQSAVKAEVDHIRKELKIVNYKETPEEAANKINVAKFKLSQLNTQIDKLNKEINKLESKTKDLGEEINKLNNTISTLSKKQESSVEGTPANKKLVDTRLNLSTANEKKTNIENTISTKKSELGEAPAKGKGGSGLLKAQYDAQKALDTAKKNEQDIKEEIFDINLRLETSHRKFCKWAAEIYNCCQDYIEFFTMIDKELMTNQFAPNKVIPPSMDHDKASAGDFQRLASFYKICGEVKDAMLKFGLAITAATTKYKVGKVEKVTTKEQHYLRLGPVIECVMNSIISKVTGFIEKKSSHKINFNNSGYIVFSPNILVFNEETENKKGYRMFFSTKKIDSESKANGIYNEVARHNSEWAAMSTEIAKMEKELLKSKNDIELSIRSGKPIDDIKKEIKHISDIITIFSSTKKDEYYGNYNCYNVPESNRFTDDDPTRLGKLVKANVDYVESVNTRLENKENMTLKDLEPNSGGV